MYQCPECNRKPFESLKGWKRHMTSIHNGYTQEQLDETVGITEGVHLTGEQSFESYAAGLPETESGLLPQEPSPEDTRRERESRQEQREREVERKQTTRRMRIRMDKLKQKLSSDAPAQAFKFAGMPLEVGEQEWMQESLETAMDVVGVDFDVDATTMVIRNKFVILLYPLLVALIIIISKMFQRYQLEHQVNSIEEQNSGSNSTQG